MLRQFSVVNICVCSHTQYLHSQLYLSRWCYSDHLLRVAIEISYKLLIIADTNYHFSLRDLQDPVINLVRQLALDSFLNSNYKHNSNLFQTKSQCPIVGKELRFLSVLLVSVLILNL